MDSIIKLKAWWILIDDQWQFLSVTRKAMWDLSLPKWGLEENESLEECAIREMAEESWRKCIILWFIWSMKYSYVSWNTIILSQVHFYSMQAVKFDSKLILNHEISSSSWLPFNLKGISMLSNESDRNFITNYYESVK